MAMSYPNERELQPYCVLGRKVEISGGLYEWLQAVPSAFSSTSKMSLQVGQSWHCTLLDTMIGSAVVVTVQSLSPVRLFVTTWIVALQASLFITISQSLLKLMSIKLVMPSNHLISVFPFSSSLQLFPASGSFPMSQFFASGGQNIGVSASASVLLMNIQDWFPLGWTDLIS